MKRLVRTTLILLATCLMSSSAFAAIDFTDDFESYALYVGPGDEGAIGGGWLIFANVWADYPGCSEQYAYGYGVFDAPNKDTGWSNITTGATGQALNTFSDYDNVDHGNGLCVETNVFQEVTFSAADAGSYTFAFDTQTPNPLGVGVNTYGFIKVLDPNNGFSQDLFETVSTVTAGSKSITVALDATADGKIVQWGFATTASNYEASSRVYDNVEFGLAPVIPPNSPDIEGVPIPLWAFLAMVGLLGYMGASKLRAAKKA